MDNNTLSSICKELADNATKADMLEYELKNIKFVCNLYAFLFMIIAIIFGADLFL